MRNDAVFLITVSAFVLLGLIVGIIFVADAWKSPFEGESIPLSRSPKLRGLVYVIGTGVIPALRDLLRFLQSDRSSVGVALVIYTLSFGITVIVGLLTLAFYALIVSFTFISDSRPHAPFWKKIALTLPYVSTAIRRGDYAFKEQLKEISVLSNELIKQRDYSVEFLTGVFIGLVDNNIHHKSGVQEFLKFTEKYLQVFIQKFLDPSPELENYRACIYFLDNKASELVFFTGVSPFHAKHSRDSLSLDESFAGWAIKRPDKVHIHVHGGHSSRKNQPPFENRKKRVRYNAVIACAIQPLREKPSNSPKLVLCIDCSEGLRSTFTRHDEYSFIKNMIQFLSVIIATAQASMEVSDDEIQMWINTNN